MLSFFPLPDYCFTDLVIPHWVYDRAHRASSVLPNVPVGDVDSTHGGASEEDTTTAADSSEPASSNAAVAAGGGGSGLQMPRGDDGAEDDDLYCPNRHATALTGSVITASRGYRFQPDTELGPPFET